MASGLALPTTPVKGRAPIETGEGQLIKIILLKCSDCESQNPFNTDVGQGGDIVFQLNSQMTQARIRTRLQAAFQQLESKGRASLATGYPQFQVDDETGDLRCDVRFINLETGKQTDFEFPLGSGSGQSTTR